MDESITSDSDNSDQNDYSNDYDYGHFDSSSSILHQSHSHSRPHLQQIPPSPAEGIVNYGPNNSGSGQEGWYESVRVDRPREKSSQPLIRRTAPAFAGTSRRHAKGRVELVEEKVHYRTNLNA